MNEQRPPDGIEWTRLPRPDGTYTKGWTWNPVAGCLHGCAWEMSDRRLAECYAKTVAEHGVAREAAHCTVRVRKRNKKVAEL